MQAKYKDGEPCEHRGCLSHLSKPCEGCGRIGGVTKVGDRLKDIQDRGKKAKEWLLEPDESNYRNLLLITYAAQVMFYDIPYLLTELQELQQALKEDDNRLIDAAIKANIDYAGCNTPDCLADRIVELEGIVEDKCVDLRDCKAALQEAQDEIKRLESRSASQQKEYKRVWDNMSKYGQEADELESKLMSLQQGWAERIESQDRILKECGFTPDVTFANLACWLKQAEARERAKNEQQIEIKNNLATLYSQSQARERQLQAKNHDLELSIVAVRAANDAWKQIVAELREEIKNLKTIWQ